MRTGFFFAVVVTLCWSGISCDSPSQPQKKISNESPVVSITTDKTNFLPGDTLRLSIHASDATLTDGVVDFKDSTMVRFNNLISVLDTTIIHIYTFTGIYTVTSSFSDGNNSTSAYLPITVTGRHFGPSLIVGMFWRFSYQYSFNAGPSNQQEWGEHSWKIVSSMTLIQDTIFTADLMRKDTIHYIYYPWGNIILDTIYTKTDSLQFTIVSSATSIQFNWPSAELSTEANIQKKIDAITMPKWVSSSSDTINVGNEIQYHLSVYDNYSGPIKFSFWNGSAHNAQREYLTLIEFIKP